MGSVLALFANWKTGIAGLIAIIGVVTQLVTTLTSTGTIQLGTTLWTDVTALAAGVGLLFAKDGNKTNSPNPTPVAHTVPDLVVKK